MTNNERDHAEYIRQIMEDDSREDTCGCSLAGWEWFLSWTLLGWIVVTCLAWWLAGMFGWYVGRAIGR